MSKKKPITKEDLIAKIEAQLSQPDLEPRIFNSLSRKLAVLRGWVRPYARTVAERQAPDPPIDPAELPKWWTDDWAKVFIMERAHGIRSGWQWEHELSKFAAKWAKAEGMTVEQLYEALRAEYAEFKAQHSAAQPEEKNNVVAI